MKSSLPYKKWVRHMNKIKLAIIFGGKSSEYSVSLHSAAGAIKNIDREKYELTFIGIDPQGSWYLCPDDVDAIEHDTWKEKALCRITLDASCAQGFLKLYDDGRYERLAIDCIFAILHGINGEDGTIQGLFQLANIPYVGCNPLSSAICMDKEVAHILCEAQGIRMAPYVSVHQNEGYSLSALKEQVAACLTFPVFVKPCNAGSSYGVTKIYDLDEIEDALNFAFRYDTKVILETGISGFEVGTAVLGNDELFVGEVDEVQTNNQFFDFAAKYDLENTEIICPARISSEKRDEIRTLAAKIYSVLGCTGLARVDLFLDDEQIVYFNEVNTIPGFTSASRYPSMMKAAGIDFTALIDKLVELALEKHHAAK